mmetsp:Transcript_43112/g.63413  ORF Transcript_43112/g.63413 Transcript_43112/m.63413 type:complete len:125 (-) Transcript_43112:48-422(-)
MDIEGWEYSVLTCMIEANEMLPFQIAVEFHWSTGGVGGPIWGAKPLPAEMQNSHQFAVDKSFEKRGYMSPYADPPTYSYKTPGEIGALGIMLFLKGGYLVVDRKDNADCLHCSEFLMARLVCAA